MRLNRLFLFTIGLLVLLAMPVLGIDIILEGDRRVTAERVTYENDKFRIVSGTGIFDVEISKVKFLEADESYRKTVQEKITNLLGQLESTKQANKELEAKIKEENADVTHSEFVRNNLDRKYHVLNQRNINLKNELNKYRHAYNNLYKKSIGLEMDKQKLAIELKQSVQLAADAVIERLKWMVLVSVNPEKNEAFVEPDIWPLLDYEIKRDIALFLAYYCGTRAETGLYFVNIKDRYSGEKLANFNKDNEFTIY